TRFLEELDGGGDLVELHLLLDRDPGDPARGAILKRAVPALLRREQGQLQGVKQGEPAGEALGHVEGFCEVAGGARRGTGRSSAGRRSSNRCSHESQDEKPTASHPASTQQGNQAIEKHRSPATQTQQDSSPTDRSAYRSIAPR